MTAMMTQKEWTGLAGIPKSFSAQTATAETPVITPSQLPRNPRCQRVFLWQGMPKSAMARPPVCAFGRYLSSATFHMDHLWGHRLVT
jgi:hypothetical protein